MSAALFERVAAGDETAVQECIDRFGPLVWSLARRFSSSLQDAEDAAQEIFIALWRSAPRFDAARASEATFVAMIARRRLIDRLRARGARPESAPATVPQEQPTGRAGEAMDAALDAARAAKAIAGLDEAQRRVLTLSVVSGWSHAEIAEHTGIALGTVKTYIRRGLVRVRDALGSAGSGKGDR